MELLEELYRMPDKYSTDIYQKEVINISEGSHLVLAPPGCGKTDLLAERVAKAISEGILPQDMLCLTFTNRAARGMSERVNQRIGCDTGNQLFVGNLHRFCSQFLFEKKIIPQSSSIIDEVDAYNIILSMIGKEENGEELEWKEKSELDIFYDIEHIVHQIEKNYDINIIDSHSVNVSLEDNVFYLTFDMEHGSGKRIKYFEVKEKYNERITVKCKFKCRHDDDREILLEYLPSELSNRIIFVVKVVKEYRKYKREHQLFDFEDLLLCAYDYLRGHQKEIHKYRWIQVDEVQDLNMLQFELIDLLTDTCEKNVVLYLGDEQQAIYSFMGAKLSTLESLKEKCKGNMHHLSNNYRSPSYLLDIYNKYAVENLGVNLSILPKAIKKSKALEGDLSIESCWLKEDEFEMVASQVIKWKEEHEDERIAVLVHSNKDADCISGYLDSKAIKHFKISGNDIFRNPTIQTLLAHFNIMYMESNFMAWSKLLRNLKVLNTYKKARSFMWMLRDIYMTPSDFFMHYASSYTHNFYKTFQGDLVIFDTETTGLNTYEDDIVQIAAIKIKAGVIIDKFNILMRTEREIPPKLGDILNPLVEEYDKAEKEDKLVERPEGLKCFMDFVGNTPTLAHNAQYDYSILDSNLRRDCKINDLNKRWGRCWDSLKLARLVEPKLRSYRLKDLLKVLNLEGNNSHLADDDIMATLSVAKHCIKKIEEVIPKQREFRKSYAPLMERLTAKYSLLYLHTKQMINKRRETQQTSALVSELRYVYKDLLSRGIIKEVPKFEYIANYLENDIINTEETPSLKEQLNKHMIEINTLKEADLCDSESMPEKIFISTVHKAKGLEFENVIATSVTDEVYPFFANQYYPEKDERNKEDARRLYVAISRAKKRLILTHYRSKKDKYGWIHPIGTSPFIKCIENLFYRGD